MDNLHLGMPEYVAEELKKRNINIEQCMVAVFLDNKEIINMFSAFIKTENGKNALQKRGEGNVIRFCFNDDMTLVLGFAVFKQPHILNVSICPFSKETRDSPQDIMDAMIEHNMWSLNFEYNTETNEVVSMKVNWDILLKTDLKGMVDNFIECYNRNKFH